MLLFTLIHKHASAFPHAENGSLQFCKTRSQRLWANNCGQVCSITTHQPTCTIKFNHFALVFFTFQVVSVFSCNFHITQITVSLSISCLKSRGKPLSENLKHLEGFYDKVFSVLYSTSVQCQMVSHRMVYILHTFVIEAQDNYMWHMCSGAFSDFCWVKCSEGFKW